jgi:hypothetical protein
MGKPGGKTPRHRWEDNIKMNLKKKGWVGMYWIFVAQDRDQWKTLVSTVMNIWVHKIWGNYSVAELLAS